LAVLHHGTFLPYTFDFVWSTMSSPGFISAGPAPSLSTLAFFTPAFPSSGKDVFCWPFCRGYRVFRPLVTFKTRLHTSIFDAISTMRFRRPFPRSSFLFVDLSSSLLTVRPLHPTAFFSLILVESRFAPSLEDLFSSPIVHLPFPCIFCQAPFFPPSHDRSFVSHLALQPLRLVNSLYLVMSLFLFFESPLEPLASLTLLHRCKQMRPQ